MEKLKISYQKVLIFLPLVLAPLFTTAQSSESSCKRAKVIIRKLEEAHVEPSSLDDSLSNKIFLNFIQLMDPNQLYFNRANIMAISRYRYEIDDFIEGRKCHFLDSILLSFEDRVQKSQEILSTFTTENLDFGEPDTLYYDYGDNPDNGLNRDIRGNWEQRIKYAILNMVWPNVDDGDVIEVALMKVLAKQKSRLSELIEDKEKLYKNIEYKFLKSIAKAYDPHTQYFSWRDKEDFDALISTEELSYGLELANNALGSIEVARLIPGSYAWQSNEIHDGDILIKIKVADGREIDLSGYVSSDVEDMLSEFDSEIELTIRKKNGALNKIRLQKQKVYSDDNLIKSFILDGAEKIAYITLPSFYTEGENSGCASDLSSEILTLKKEGIDGIILDLRSNGGGSMGEAIKLSGIFVDGGAICIRQEANKPPFTLKDPSRGVIYDGPLVVMIDGGSASASELFSGAMQDHNRGLLVGSRTYGKATGQNITPLNLSLKDFLKITTLKFYRVTGDTHQRTGIQPDIFLPGLKETLGRSESSYSNALSAGHINKRTYYTKLDPLPVQELAKKSRERVEGSLLFESLVNDQARHNQYLKNGRLLIPVDFKGYEAFNNEIFGSEKQSEKNVWGPIKIELNARDQEISEIDSYGATSYKILSKRIECDVHLRETYDIMKDYIELIRK